MQCRHGIRQRVRVTRLDEQGAVLVHHLRDREPVRGDHGQAVREGFGDDAGIALARMKRGQHEAVVIPQGRFDFRMTQEAAIANTTLAALRDLLGVCSSSRPIEVDRAVPAESGTRLRASPPRPWCARDARERQTACSARCSASPSGRDTCRMYVENHYEAPRSAAGESC